MGERRLSPNGEWLERQEDVVTVGLTRAAVARLGTIVGVHYSQAAASVHQGDVVVVIESSKAAIDCEAPLSGCVKAKNQALHSSPHLLNQAPESAGWLYRLEQVDDHEWDQLLTVDKDSRMTHTAP